MPNSDGTLNICVDFDGVLHQYTGWKGDDVFDGPVMGAPECMQYLARQGHTLILHTTRAVTPKLKSWLEQHKVPIHYFNESPRKPSNSNSGKPLADVYLDDRGVQFNGNWPDAVQQIESFKPWYKR